MINKLICFRNCIESAVLDFWGPQKSDCVLRTEQIVAQFFSKALANSVKLSPYEVFWGLKDYWWMQIFDGRFHRYGSKVFDEGLHGHDKEPGYYKNIQQAAEFASERIKEPISVEFYKNLHRIACAHFDGIVTNMKGEEAGKFEPVVCYNGDYLSLLPNLSSNEIKSLKHFAKIAERGKRYEKEAPEEQIELLKQWGYSEPKELFTVLVEARASLEEVRAKIEEQIKQTNAHIALRSTQLGLEPIATLYLTEDTFPWNVRIYYECKNLESIVSQLFENFTKEISQAQSSDEKIAIIADLYQMLEWVHPFPDGQGRIDLLILSWLLCKYGLNPPILNSPFYSTFAPLNSWISYLKEGMEKWRSQFFAVDFKRGS